MTEKTSNFKGFSEVANSTYKLTTLDCHKCDNNCTISSMTTRTPEGKEKKSFFGSRCDQFDSIDGAVKNKENTPFTEREKLLYADYDPAKGTGKKVGIPRALMTHDMAPLMIGFLKDLGVKVEISSPTNNGTVKHSLEKAYADTCYPTKLLHGHVEELLNKGNDFVMIPNAIRMGKKNGEEDQHYSCPLIQAGPYIVKSVFELDKKLLDPVIDFSRGDAEVIDSFAEIATRMGFSKKEGTRAANEGLKKQREFEQKMQEKGKELLQRLKDNPELTGVVLLSRAYNAQDQGANLGITSELDKLGVIPVPMDFLPLNDVNVFEVSDRPYWNYERKIYAASKIINENPQLFGLFLTNFGCGPNSFIQNVVEDMMGGKPLGQIEVDEHAAEAGIITRLEAFVDNIQGYKKSGFEFTGKPEDYKREVPSIVNKKEQLVIPSMADHAGVLVAAMRAYGVDARVLPRSDRKSMNLSRDITNGKECLPFRDSLGQGLREARDGNLAAGTNFFMAGSFGPCRLGKYALEQQRAFNKLAIPVKVLTSVSNNAYSDLGLGRNFELLAWRGLISNDLLQKMLWTTRPYEKAPGQADAVYSKYYQELMRKVQNKEDLKPLLKAAERDFLDVKDKTKPQKPLVGINGEIYLRSNEFCNNDLVRNAEASGLEVEVAPMAEWINYINLRHVQDAWKNKNIKKLVTGIARRLFTQAIENGLAAKTDRVIFERDHTTRELLAKSSLVLPSRNGSEAVLSLGSGIEQMEDPRYAGVISVMPHGCMPGGIVAAFSEQLSKEYNKPWISLTYDGSPETGNSEKVADLGEQLQYAD
jgi:predicted nucleotide-binding protein (sugar kinase/HSP70/actin superfamily)